MEKKIAQCVDSIMKLEEMEKSLTEAKDRDAEKEILLREARISGENIADRDLSQLENQSRNSEKNLIACRSLILKKNLELIGLEKTFREQLDASKIDLQPEMMKFRQECSKKLSELLLECQILVNFTRGEQFGNDLLTLAKDYLFYNQEVPENGPHPYITLLERFHREIGQRFQKTPLAKLEAIKIKQSTIAGESVEATVEKLLSAARARLVKKTPEAAESNVAGSGEVA